VLRSRWKVRVRSEDQGLMGAGDDPDGLGLFAVPGHRPQLGPVDADHVGQRVRIALVAFGPGGGITLGEPGDLPGVDREDSVVGGEQGLHPGAPVGLDPDHDFFRLEVLAAVSGDQRVQPGDSFYPLGQPGRSQFLAGLVLDLHIVVVFGPVIADEQQPAPPHDQPIAVVTCGRTARGLMDPVLTPNNGGHATPSAVTPPGRPAGARSDLRTCLLQAPRVLTRRRLPGTESAKS